MPPVPEKKSTPNAAKPLLDHVLEELGQEIVSGAIGAGDTFKLLDISERFSISRTVAREAMRALEQLGLVSSSRRIGITVLPPERWAVFDRSIIRWRLNDEGQREGQLQSLTELRIAIEPIAARSVALHASKEERARLQTLAREMRELGDAGMGASPRFLEADISFHELILRYAHNEMFAALAPSIGAVLEGRTNLGLQPDVPEALALDSHEKLAKAIMERDADAAEEASRGILNEVRDALSSMK
ncbi:FadR/GntR family transcriptional regulator [Corynebacterium pacaense]|uniref:FadR/GntR family transcriptional regulator n=1 Tax=Corynebacterium pacaense TaxID=1816684 RepID=UPI0009B9A4E5|nr:FadR/GntR family transcriptional regulator [Corynebacterium pacaense]